MGKKIIFFLILLVILIAYTVFTFDYKTILSDNSNTNSPSFNTKENIVELAKNNYNSLKEKIFDLNDEKTNKKIINDPIDIELVNKDGVIVMNGIFKNKEQLDKISDILNINRDGEYKFNPSIDIDENILNKVAELITPFKDFFLNNSKLILKGDKVSLNGTLKDKTYNDLLTSIIKRVGLDIEKNIDTFDTKEDKLNQKDEVLSDDTGKIVKNSKIEDKLNDIISPKQIQSDINDILKKNKITFERRSTKITKDSYIAVKQVAQILNDNENIKIEIAGHTDSRGKNSLNKRISQDRANSVKDALIDLGIDKSRLKAVGYGEDFPIAKDDKDGLSQINRRVEIKILGNK